MCRRALLIVAALIVVAAAGPGRVAVGSVETGDALRTLSVGGLRGAWPVGEDAVAVVAPEGGLCPLAGGPARAKLPDDCREPVDLAPGRRFVLMTG